MKKYLQIAKNTWTEMLMYRLSFIIWRMRNVLQILTVYFLWLVILPSGKSFGGYTQSMMLTYVLGTALMNSIVLTTKSFSIGEEINDGTIANFLLRPMNYFAYWFARDLGDKSMNLLFSIGEISILLLLLRPPLFIQTNPLYLVLSCSAIVFALLIYFFISILLGLIGFWSSETWGPRFIFLQLLSFFAGGLFPLDILPKAIFTVMQFLPFTYLLYFPIKIYLGQLPLSQVYSGLVISFIWIFLMYLLMQFVWKQGLKAYTAQGS